MPSKLTMTQKDFVAIAEALKDGRDATLAKLDPGPQLQNHQLMQAIQQIHASTCASIAKVLAKQNARFDRGRFLAACGVSPANHI